MKNRCPICKKRDLTDTAFFVSVSEVHFVQHVRLCENCIYFKTVGELFRVELEESIISVLQKKFETLAVTVKDHVTAILKR